MVVDFEKIKILNSSTQNVNCDVYNNTFIFLLFVKSLNESTDKINWYKFSKSDKSNGCAFFSMHSM